MGSSKIKGVVALMIEASARNAARETIRISPSLRMSAALALPVAFLSEI
jgi:hypothetical protein